MVGDLLCQETIIGLDDLISLSQERVEWLAVSKVDCFIL
jgi:hypothetical protein